MLQELLKRLRDTWGHDPAETEEIRAAILEYSQAVLLDSQIVEEFEQELADGKVTS